MKDAKVLLIIKNVDVELLEKIQKLIKEYNIHKRTREIMKGEKRD